MLIPDVVYEPRILLEDALGAVIPDADSIDHAVESVTDLNPLNGLQGLVVRVNEIFIKDNRRSWPLGIGDRPADIYPIFLVANGGNNEPVKFELPGIFNGVLNNSRLPIAEPGLTIHRDLSSVPQFLDIHVLAMRSRQSQRDFATALNEALESDEGKSLINTMQTISSTANAGVGIAVGAATSLLQLYLRYLKATKDKQLFYSVVSLEKHPDVFGIGRTYTLEHERFGHVIIEIHGIYQ